MNSESSDERPLSVIAHAVCDLLKAPSKMRRGRTQPSSSRARTAGADADDAKAASSKRPARAAPLSGHWCGVRRLDALPAAAYARDARGEHRRAALFNKGAERDDPRARAARGARVGAARDARAAPSTRTRTVWKRRSRPSSSRRRSWPWRARGRRRGAQRSC